MPLIMTRNKLSGLRDSVASSVWRPNFRRTLLTLPDFHLEHLEFAIPYCDACHLGKRVSTLTGKASGRPYDPTTFEVRLRPLICLSYNTENIVSAAQRGHRLRGGSPTYARPPVPG